MNTYCTHATPKPFMLFSTQYEIEMWLSLIGITEGSEFESLNNYGK